MQILNDFRTGHSMGCYRLLKINGKTFATHNIIIEYAKSCTYKPTHGELEINLTKKELIEIENIEGVWTIKKDNNKAIILTSTGNKHTYKVVREECWIVGKSHSSKSYTEALRLEALKRKDQNVKKMFISSEDVHKYTGACYSGIKSFCERNNLNPKYGYRVDYLLSLGDTYGNTYLRKFINN